MAEAYMVARTRECLRCHATRIVSKHEHKSGDKCPSCGCVAYHDNELFIASDVIETARLLVASGDKTENGYEEMAAMQLRRPEDYRIWWTSDGYCHALEHEDVSGLPVYVQEELGSRIGRAGNGRLWIAEGIPVKEMIEPHHAPMGWGGIVIHLEDAHRFRGRQGFLTDLHGNIP